ncbi:MAG: polyprenyl synthetase family protein [Bacillota bacterium]|nr:polyprenyl synthetase family protein [Bacillota bacterium]
MLSSPRLERVDERLAAVISSEGQATRAIMSYLAATRGKRLRPLLVFLCAEAFSLARPATGSEAGPPGRSAPGGSGAAGATAGAGAAVTAGAGPSGSEGAGDLVDLAAAVELVHLASLLHDDLVDGAAERRGMPTVNAVWGPATAVLSGDYLFAAAFAMLVERRQFRALGILSRALKAMSEAEVEQLAALFDTESDEARYWRCVRGKTASLFAAACEGGAAAGGAGPVQRALARSFGLHLGSAFQVADDLADVVGATEKLGKPVGQDLSRGLITLPLIFLLARTEHAGRLRRMIADRCITQQGLAWVRDAAMTSGAACYTRAAAARCIDRARDCLKAMNRSGFSQARAILEPLAEYVLATTLGPA